MVVRSGKGALSASLLLQALTPSSIRHRFPGPFAPRTHVCNSLGPRHIGQTVVLTGWILPPRRISKSLTFFPLRDSTGLTQLVIRTGESIDIDARVEKIKNQMESLATESVIWVRGIVRQRPGANQNPNISSGSIEVEVQDFKLLNPVSIELPFQPSDTHNLPNEDTRAKYRYLDLRRSQLTNNLKVRSQVSHAARCYLHDQDFTEVETPILLRSTPEGAREFLVPTRTSKLSNQQSSTSLEPLFYALQQSPQQPKQLLVSSGSIDRYFQLAKCFRDEDGRKDRQPEFTQIDLEMSFISGGPKSESSGAPNETESDLQSDASRESNGRWRIGGEEIRETVEGLVGAMWEKARGEKIESRFNVITYDEAMRKYGSDKPDIRFALEIFNLDSALRTSCSSVVDTCSTALNHSLEILIYRPSSEEGKLSTKDLDSLLTGKDGNPSKLEKFRSRPSAPHEITSLLLKKSRHLRHTLSSLGVQASEVSVEDLTSGVLEALSRTRLQKDEPHGEGLDSCYIFVGVREEPPTGGSTELGELRLRLAEKLKERGVLELSSEPHFLWVTEFPLFTKNDEDKLHLSKGRWSATHHPFTAPMYQDVEVLRRVLEMKKSSCSSQQTALGDELLSNIRGQHYDLVLDGVEIGGGSVRIHDGEMQEDVFSRVLELTPEETAKFSHLLHALRCGAPPHGGLAIGLDRFLSILLRTSSIRDVIAFPKNGSGFDPVFKSPAGLEKIEEGAAEGERAEDVLKGYGLRRL